jgi:hypothetical protein
MCRLHYNTDRIWRINLFLVTIYGIGMQYLCEHICQPDINNCLYRYRYQRSRLQQHGDGCHNSKSTTPDYCRSDHFYMYRLIHYLNRWRRLYLFVDTINRPVMQHMLEHHRKPHRNNYLYGYGYKLCRLHQPGICYHHS